MRGGLWYLYCECTRGHRRLARAPRLPRSEKRVSELGDVVTRGHMTRCTAERTRRAVLLLAWFVRLVSVASGRMADSAPDVKRVTVT